MNDTEFEELNGHHAGHVAAADHHEECLNGHAHEHDGEDVFPDELTVEHVREAATHPHNEFREAGVKFLAFYDQVLAFIIAYENPRLAAMVIALATGRTVLTNGMSGAELAQRLGCSKANVSKCCKEVQARFGCDIRGIAPLPGQRSVNGCRRMAIARKEQLKNKDTNGINTQG